MRGEHGPLLHADRLVQGIIPACAGSTTTGRPSTSRPWDHPRMRGEHDEPVSIGSPPEGSSPHARGARGVHHSGHVGTGIIPACAGSTPSRRTGRSSPRDHPRMRGEHCARVRPYASSQGSSPHARGALELVDVLLYHAGIIPACAGSTRSAAPSTRPCWDHPRMRGEHPPSPR